MQAALDSRGACTTMAVHIDENKIRLKYCDQALFLKLMLSASILKSNFEFQTWITYIHIEVLKINLIGTWWMYIVHEPDWNQKKSSKWWNFKLWTQTNCWWWWWRYGFAQKKSLLPRATCMGGPPGSHHRFFLLTILDHHAPRISYLELATTILLRSNTKEADQLS